MTLSCTCSSRLISEAVLEHDDVLADSMRLPEAGINLSMLNSEPFSVEKWIRERMILSSLLMCLDHSVPQIARQ